MNIAVFANTTWYLYNFRLNTIKALQRQGHNVIAISPSDSKYVKMLQDEGIQHIHVTMAGSSINPFFELGTLFHLYKCFKSNKIDLVLSFTPKANIYAALLSAPLRIHTLSNVSGLGRVFIKNSFLTSIVTRLYKIAFLFSEHVFFQNEDDRKLFLEYRITKKFKTSILPGSGVDLTKFVPGPGTAKKGNGLVFLLVSRMLWDKGIGEFISAARIIKKKYPDTRFSLLGELNVDNPSAIPEVEIQAWVDEGIVSYLGNSDNVQKHLLDADCVVLPSYREGTPRSLLEAAACGKPVITTDTPGCRNVVDDSVTGFLCKTKDAEDLAKKMTTLIEFTSDERLEFGQQGRLKMEAEYDEQTVIKKYFNALQNVPEGRYRIRRKLIEHMTL